MKPTYFDKLKIGDSGWMDGVDNDLSAPSSTRFINSWAVNQAIQALVLAGANPGEIYNVRSYGAVPNVSIPASGPTVTGSNNKTAIDTAIAAAPSNAIVLIPAGNFGCFSPLAPFTSKRIFLLSLGNIYTNGADFLTVNAAGGLDRCHNVMCLGSIIGRVNIPSHTRTAWLNNTGPDFDNFTGSAVKIGPSVNAAHFFLNHIEGFQNAVLMENGAGVGSQENTFAGQLWRQNSNGIHMRSTDGVSWCDKNVFTGFHGGCLRISGGTGIKIDGYPNAAATNGEIYNGAFRSNKFNVMLEKCIKWYELNGDITEPLIDITHEGGTETGVFDTPAIQARSVSPNYVRGAKWHGQGVLGIQWLTGGMGIDSTIEMPVWNVGTFIGNRGRTDSSGNIVMEVRHNLSKSSRDAAVAINSALRFVNEQPPKTFRDITGSTGSNTIADAYGVIRFNNAAGTFTAASASTNVNVRFTLMNIHPSAALTVASVTGLTSLAAGRSVDIECDGVSYRAVINP